METLRKAFGRRFRALREARGHSREFLAQKAELEPSSIYRLEKGEQWIAPESLERVAKFFQVSPAVFFTDDVVQIRPTPQEALSIVAQAIGAELPRLVSPDQEEELRAKDLLIQSLQARLAAIESQQEWAARLSHCFPKDQRDIQDKIKDAEAFAISKQTSASGSPSSARKAGGKPPGNAP